MALGAIVGNALVIKLRRLPRRRRMAAAALDGRRNVSCRLGHRIRAVVALTAIGRVHLRVIELRG